VTRAWRLVKTKYLSNAFTGEGASLEGGRWNSAGVRVVYTSSSPSLALLETLVNIESIVPLPAYSLVTVEFEDGLVERLPPGSLPANWLHYPPPIETQQIGDLWAAEGRSCVLAVPSTVVTQDVNYVLNPMHHAFSSLVISPPTQFTIDPRLLALIGSA
jgi:RES domain-containing protein